MVAGLEVISAQEPDLANEVSLTYVYAIVDWRLGAAVNELAGTSLPLGAQSRIPARESPR
jgi:hypothetical protein